MTELKPCPLCGGKVTAIETHPGRGGLYCSRCDLVLGGNEAKTPDELTAAWNRRAGMDGAGFVCPVRCGECAHSKIERHTGDELLVCWWRPTHGEVVEPGHFCGYGVKRHQADNDDAGAC